MSKPTIRKLEWYELENNWWTAEDNLLRLGFEVRKTDSDQTRIRLPGDGWGYVNCSPDEAKAMAQADYERRVLSAIVLEASKP